MLSDRMFLHIWCIAVKLKLTQTVLNDIATKGLLCYSEFIYIVDSRCCRSRNHRLL